MRRTRLTPPSAPVGVHDMVKTFDPGNALVNYTPVTESGCWLWNGGWNVRGYGKCSRHGKVWAYAHRLFYTHFVGPIPDGACVMHKCDTPPCCNPDHLILGTRHENTLDMWIKGRARPGGRPATLSRRPRRPRKSAANTMFSQAAISRATGEGE